MIKCTFIFFFFPTCIYYLRFTMQTYRLNGCPKYDAKILYIYIWIYMDLNVNYCDLRLINGEGYSQWVCWMLSSHWFPMISQLLTSISVESWLPLPLTGTLSSHRWERWELVEIWNHMTMGIHCIYNIYIYEDHICM